jgi:hypothetical protein
VKTEWGNWPPQVCTCIRPCGRRRSRRQRVCPPEVPPRCPGRARRTTTVGGRYPLPTTTLSFPTSSRTKPIPRGLPRNQAEDAGSTPALLQHVPSPTFVPHNEPCEELAAIGGSRPPNLRGDRCHSGPREEGAICRFGGELVVDRPTPHKGIISHRRELKIREDNPEAEELWDRGAP